MPGRARWTPAGCGAGPARTPGSQPAAQCQRAGIWLQLRRDHDSQRRGLLKIYSHCSDGQADAANQRITDALGAKDTEPEPGDEADGDSEKAS